MRSLMLKLADPPASVPGYVDYMEKVSSAKHVTCNRIFIFRKVLHSKQVSSFRTYFFLPSQNRVNPPHVITPLICVIRVVKRKHSEGYPKNKIRKLCKKLKQRRLPNMLRVSLMYTKVFFLCGKNKQKTNIYL